MRAEADAHFRRPHRHLCVSRSISALFFLVPLYMMIVTSLKGMPEIRLGQPLQPAGASSTFQPWVDAWLDACTGRDCNGLSPGFLNSVKITVPSVDHLDHLRLDQRLRADLLALQGRQPPLRTARVRRLRALPGGDLSADHRAELGRAVRIAPGIIIVHTIFGMPILTLLFRNFYRGAAGRAVQGGARRRRRLLAHLLLRSCCRCRCRSSIVAVILQVTGIWNDFLFGLVFAGRANWPMTVQLNNIVNTTGRARVQRQHGGDDPDRGGPAHRSISSPAGWFVRGIAAGAVKG